MTFQQVIGYKSKKTASAGLLMAAILLLSAGSAYAQSADPLAQFRRDAAPQQQQQSQQSTTQSAGQGQVPPPTMGDFQTPSNFNEFPEMDLGLTPEEQREEAERQMRESAYDAAITGLMPLEPEEIDRLLERYRVIRESSEQRVGGKPKPVIKVETVSLEPGSVPSTISVSPGHVTSVNLMDITGQPWPIEEMSWGGDFEVVSPGSGGHVIRITPLKAHAMGNLSVQLAELNTPVVFTLETQLEEVQYRFDARIPLYGPLATTPIIDPGVTITAGTDRDMTSILQGVIPTSASRKTLNGTDGRTSVYALGGTIYLRTPLTLLSPAWNSSVKSGDGMTVYSLSDTPVILLSDKGKLVRVSVED